MRRGLVRMLVTAVVLASVGAGLGSTDARADDAGLWAAWTSRDAEAERAIQRLGRGLRIARRSDGRRVRKARRAIRSLRPLGREVRGAVAAQEPSSEGGARAKTYALRTFVYVRRALHAFAGELRAARRGRPRVANRYARRGDRYSRAWDRNARRANRQFRALGFERDG